MQTQTLTRRGILAGTALAALAGANIAATKALAEAAQPSEADLRLTSVFGRMNEDQKMATIAFLETMFGS